MEETTCEKSSVSAFLWKAAISTIGSHPVIAANLLLKCKKALNETNIGVKFKKVSRRNVCQSCGYPWSVGKFQPEIRKTFKAAKIKKVLKKNVNTPGKLSRFDKHLLERYSACQSNLILQCHNCLKETEIPTQLPPKPLIKKMNNHPGIKEQKHTLNKDKNPPKALLNPAKTKQNNKKKKPSSKVPPKVEKKTLKPNKKQEFSKNQLKNLSKQLQSKKSGGSLQSFLNSVK